jgi:hypothetical protein
MFKRFIKARSVLVIVSLAVFVDFPIQTTKADAVSCVIAMAEAAAAYAEMQAACSGSPSGGACEMARANHAMLLTTAVAECQ